MNYRFKVVIGKLDTVFDLYESGDICVQPSKTEGIGFMVF